MKIWKAELILSTTLTQKKIENRVDFYFEQMKGDFKENQKFDEYITNEGWICTTIPKNMKYEQIYGNPKIIQGFDHKLNEEELKNLKNKMKEFMIENLKKEKECFIKDIDTKIKLIKQE